MSGLDRSADSGVQAGALAHGGTQPRTLVSVAREHERKPYPSEDTYFRANRTVAGMAADDGKIIINPHTGLSETERDAVRINELTRLKMRHSPEHRPTFDLTPSQRKTFGGYGSIDDQRQTVIARIISGDPSAGDATDEQKAWAEKVRGSMLRGAR